jgi:hypothetical protein
MLIETHRALLRYKISDFFSSLLEHESSTIKRLEIDYSGFAHSACWDYTRKPAQLQDT